MKWFFPLAAALGVLLMLGGCFALERSLQATPERLMEAYLEAFQQRDLQLMLQLSDSLETSEAERAFLEKIVEMIELKSFSIDGVEFDSEDEAVVTITVELLLMGQTKSLTDQVEVNLKEGQWFIRGGMIDLR